MRKANTTLLLVLALVIASIYLVNSCNNRSTETDSKLKQLSDSLERTSEKYLATQVREQALINDLKVSDSVVSMKTQEVQRLTSKLQSDKQAATRLVRKHDSLKTAMNTILVLQNCDSMALRLVKMGYKVDSLGNIVNEQNQALNGSSSLIESISKTAEQAEAERQSLLRNFLNYSNQAASEIDRLQKSNRATIRRPHVGIGFSTGIGVGPDGRIGPVANIGLQFIFHEFKK